MSLIRLHQYGTCDKSKNRQTRWRQKGWEDAGQQQPIILNLDFPGLAGIDRHPAVAPHPLHPGIVTTAELCLRGWLGSFGISILICTCTFYKVVRILLGFIVQSDTSSLYLAYVKINTASLTSILEGFNSISLTAIISTSWHS